MKFGILVRGVATGGIWVYIPPKISRSNEVNFLLGRIDLRTAIIEREY